MPKNWKCPLCAVLLKRPRRVCPHYPANVDRCENRHRVHVDGAYWLRRVAGKKRA